jgi:beta-glucanase (GH16 family)
MRITLVALFTFLLFACGGGGGIPNGPSSDVVAPVIALSGSTSMTLELGTAYEEPGATATDNVDGPVDVEIAGSVDDALGVYTLTYTATDSSFNTRSVTRTVTIIAPITTIKPLDSNKWHHQTVIPNGWSWFNGEQQHYTDRMENSYISDGTLKIVAQKEQFTDQGVTKQYTSARLNSKFAFTYGRVEVRAKMPIGHGTWPAIWMLGKNITERGAYWETQGYGTTSWPACGEIDIMEHWGSNLNNISSAMHTPSSHGGTINKGSQYISTATTAFHIYTLDWTAERMVFAVNGVEHYTYEPTEKTPDTWPFDADQFLLLNVAIESGIDANFSASAMEVDYVRVYNTSDALVWSDEFD